MTLKKQLIALMALLAVTDIAVLLDIPFLRQTLGFLCFITVPGLLIIYALKLDRVSFLKKFLLTIGLSLAFLIIVGLVINLLLPSLGYAEPLATLPLLIGFNLILAILAFSLFRRRGGSQTAASAAKLSDFMADIKSKPLWPLLFPLLFPLLVVIGRNIMDTGGSNVVLLFTFLLIPLYIILLVWQHKKVPSATYPLAIGMISLAVLLARGLLSSYLVGDDIYAEYHAFQLTSDNLRWDIEAYRNNVGACLSVTLLPTVFQSIMKIDPVYIFKIVLLLPVSLIPVIGYVLYRRYVSSLYGIFAAFFFIAQPIFIYTLSGHMRMAIAMIPFTLAILVLFDEGISPLSKRVLYFIFLFTALSSYYTLAIIFLLILFILWLIQKVAGGRWGLRAPSDISFNSAIILPLVLVFFWWSQITVTAFTDYVLISKEVFVNLSNMLLGEVRGYTATSLYTLPEFSPVLLVPGIIQRIILVFVIIGVAYMSIKRKVRERFSGYVALMIACSFLLAAIIILPMVSLRYAPDRLYSQILVFLAPAFVFGGEAVLDAIGRVRLLMARAVPSWRNFRQNAAGGVSYALLAFILVLLLGQYLSASTLLHQFAGFSGREITDKNSMDHGIFYTYESEVLAAKWLGANNTDRLTVYLGSTEYVHRRSVFEYTEYSRDDASNFTIAPFSKKPPIPDSYVFLRYFNVVVGRVSAPDIDPVPGKGGTLISPPLENFAFYYTDRNKIYDNGSSEIYR